MVPTKSSNFGDPALAFFCSSPDIVLIVNFTIVERSAAHVLPCVAPRLQDQFEERDGKCVLTSNFIYWNGWKSTSPASRLMYGKCLSPMRVDAKSLDTQILKTEQFDSEGRSRFVMLGEAINDQARRISEWADELEEERRTCTTSGKADGREEMSQVLSKYSLLLSGTTIGTVVTAVHALNRHDAVERMIGRVRTNATPDWLESSDSRLACVRIAQLQRFTADRLSLHCNALAEVSNTIHRLCDQAARYPAGNTEDATHGEGFRNHAGELSKGLHAMAGRMKTRSDDFDKLSNDLTAWLTGHSPSKKTLKKLRSIRQQSYDNLKSDLECLDASLSARGSMSQQSGGANSPAGQSSKKRSKRRKIARSSQTIRSDQGDEEDREDGGAVGIGDDSLTVSAQSIIKTNWLPISEDDDRSEGTWTEIKGRDLPLSSGTNLAKDERSIPRHAFEFRQLVIGSDTKFTRPENLPDPDFGTASLLSGSAALPQLVMRGRSPDAPLTEDQEAARLKAREERLSADEQWRECWEQCVVLKPTESELLEGSRKVRGSLMGIAV